MLVTTGLSFGKFGRGNGSGVEESCGDALGSAGSIDG